MADMKPAIAAGSIDPLTLNAPAGLNAAAPLNGPLVAGVATMTGA